MKRILIPLIFTFCSTLSATTYFVSTSGNNTNNGLTTTTPWQTLEYAEAHAIAAGDIIALKKGDIWSSATCVTIKHSGSSGNPIVWDGSLWGTGANAAIKSSGNRSSGNDAIVNIITCSNVTFKNISIDGNNTQTYGLVIGGHTGFSNNNQSNETNITIDGCSILNIGNGGDYRIGFLCQTWNSSMSNIIIQNCTLDGSDDEQLSFYPGKTQDGSSAYEISNIIIRNNTLTNWGRRGASTGYGMQINNKCTGVVVEYNTLVQGPNGKGDAFHLESNEQVAGYMPAGVKVRYNEMTVTRSNDWCVVIQQGQAKTADFYQNLFIQGNNQTDANGGAIWIIVSSSPSYTGASLNFFNNTIYTTSGISFQNDCSTAGVSIFRNNIVYNSGTVSGNSCAIFNTSGSTAHSNNLYFRKTAGDILFIRDGNNTIKKSGVLAWEPTGNNSDPLFMDIAGSNFHLQAGSPSIGAGIAISGITQDIEGVTVSNPPNIGCYETVAGSPALVYSNSVVENATPNLLTINYNLSLANIVPDPSVFVVQVNSVSKTVNSVAIVNGKVQLNFSSPIVYGDIITLSYTKPSVNPLQTVSGALAASIGAKSVTNNCISPIPVYVSSVVENATSTLLEISYNLVLNNIVPAVSAFNVQVNSVARTVSSISIVGSKVRLTLANAVVFGEIVTVAYIRPASNPLQTASGGVAASFSSKSVTNNCLPPIPVYVSSVVNDASPTLLEMTYNLTLANIVPAVSAFNVQVNSVARAISSVAVVGTNVRLTLASPVVYGDIISVSYTKSASNPLQTALGGVATSISSKSVTNSCLSPIPVYVSSVVESAAPSLLVMTYNLVLANIVPAVSAFNVQVNSVARGISSVSIVGGKIQLTLTSGVLFGDLITVAYLKPATNPLQTSSGGVAASISSQSVTNNCASPVPVYFSSVVNDASPALLEMTYNIALANIVPAVSAFNVQVNSLARAVNSVSIVGSKVQLTLASQIVYGDIITVSYIKPAINPLQGASGGTAASISAKSVTNNCIAPIPVYVSSIIENGTPTILLMTYSLALANIVPAVSAFNVQVNSVARIVTSVSIAGGNVRLTLSSAVVFGDIVTVAYTKPSSNALQTPIGGVAASLSASKSVTNNLVAPEPLYVSSAIENATPSILTITYDIGLANIIPVASAFYVLVNSVARTVNSVSIVGGNVRLTLANPVVFGDIITVAYTKPTSNPLQTSSGGVASSISSKSVTNNCEAPPLYVGSVIENATPTILNMTYNASLANIVPVTSAFYVLVNSVARTINSVAIVGSNVRLTLISPVVYGDIVTVTYTKPANNQVQTSSGGMAASISAKSVTNNCVAPPVYISSAIENATPTLLSMKYNLSLANIVPVVSAFYVLVNSLARTINSVTIVGGNVQLTLSSPVVYGDIITVSYSKPANNPLQTVSGGIAASISAISVTNNLVPPIPVYISSVIENATPSILEMTYNITLANIVPVASSFNVRVNSATRAVNSIAVVGGKVRLTLASPAVYGDRITVSYTKPTNNPLQSVSGGVAASFRSKSVTNNCISILPVYLSSVIEDATPGILEMTYSVSLANIVPPASAFTVLVNSVTRSVGLVAIVGSKVRLTLLSPVVGGDIVTVTYNVPASNQLQSASGSKATGISGQLVTNNCGLVIPLYISSVVENVTPTLLEMTFSLSLANIVPAITDFYVLVNSIANTIDSVNIIGGKVQLTLEEAIVFGDTVTISYTKPAIKPLQATSGGLAENIINQKVTNNCSPVIPQYISSKIDNLSPALLEISYDLPLTNIVPAVSVFNVKVNSVSRSVNSVAIIGGKVQLTLSSAVVYGDIVTIDYTRSASNQLQTASGGVAASINSESVTNNCASPPVYVSSVVENATPNLLDLIYDLDLANIVPATSAFNVQVNSITVTVNSVLIDGNEVRLTLSDAVVFGDIVTIGYTSPSSNPLQTSSAGLAASFSGQAVTNNCEEIPEYINSIVEDATPLILDMTYDLDLTNIVPDVSAFYVQVNSVSRAINSVAIVGGRVRLTLASIIFFGDRITVSYAKPANNPLQTTTGALAAGISEQSVTNNCQFTRNMNDPPTLVVNNVANGYSGFVYDLDASESYDSNNDTLIYEWILPDNVSASSTNGSKIQFLAPVVSTSQNLEFKLNVTDGRSIVSKIITINIMPYKPELRLASISNINASNYLVPDYPNNIIDNNLTTKWAVNGDNQWLIFTLAQSFKINYLEIAFLQEQKYESFFDIYASSDNFNWDHILTNITSCNFSGNFQVFDFPKSNTKTEYQYVKLVGKGNKVNSLNSFSEFKIFGTPHTEEVQTTIYPNPAKYFLNISINYANMVPPITETTSSEFVRIYDIAGILVFEKLVDIGMKNIQIPINLKPGIYIVQMILDGLTLSANKLIVTP